MTIALRNATPPSPVGGGEKNSVLILTTGGTIDKQSLDNTLEYRLNAEGEAFARCSGTPDFTEAIIAL